MFTPGDKPETPIKPISEERWKQLEELRQTDPAAFLRTDEVKAITKTDGRGNVDYRPSLDQMKGMNDEQTARWRELAGNAKDTVERSAAKSASPRDMSKVSTDDFMKGMELTKNLWQANKPINEGMPAEKVDKEIKRQVDIIKKFEESHADAVKDPKYQEKRDALYMEYLKANARAHGGKVDEKSLPPELQKFANAQKTSDHNSNKQIVDNAVKAEGAKGRHTVESMTGALNASSQILENQGKQFDRLASNPKTKEKFPELVKADLERVSKEIEQFQAQHPGADKDPKFQEAKRNYINQYKELASKAGLKPEEVDQAFDKARDQAVAQQRAKEIGEAMTNGELKTKGMTATITTYDKDGKETGKIEVQMKQKDGKFVITGDKDGKPLSDADKEKVTKALQDSKTTVTGEMNLPSGKTPVQFAVSNANRGEFHNPTQVGAGGPAPTVGVGR